MKMLKRVLASFLACAVTCTTMVTVLAADFPTRTEETKGYLNGMNVKDGRLDEWGLIGLAASGIDGDEETVQEIITTALDDISENEFDGNGMFGTGSAGQLAKLIFLLHFQGISPYTFGANGDFEGYNLVAALFNSDFYYVYASAYATPYALMVYDTLAVSVAEEATYKYSREDLIDLCLSLVANDIDASGTFPGGTTGMTGVAGWEAEAPYDFESTAMVLQALAPYHLDGSRIDPLVAGDVADAVSDCINSLSQAQQDDGGFPYAFFDYTDWQNPVFIDYYNSADATAQIMLALTAAGMDLADTNYMGSGPSILDNILSSEYETPNAGEFRANSESVTDYYDPYYTTKFAYLALLSYEKATEGGSFAPFSLFSSAAPVSYGDYDYSFYYDTDNNNTDNTGNNGNTGSTGSNSTPSGSTNKEPVKTGDTFPAAILMVLAAGSVAGMMVTKKAKAK